MQHNPRYPRSLVAFKEQYLKIAEDYMEHPEKYTREFSVRINGKLRHLMTYQSNEYGFGLRQLHAALVAYLRTKHQQASSSYAYARNKSILDCLNAHLRAELFLKTDIHSYFDSISYANMMVRIERLRTSQGMKKALSIILKACFFNDSLPIGFVSSPILSDIFLTDVDKMFESVNGVNYTRYADDFIISVDDVKNAPLLYSVKDDLDKELSALSLKLNEKKTYYRHLKMIGDAIHVLGVNLVKTSSANKITISDKYIRETCKMIAEYIHAESEVKENLFPKVLGRIEFIRHCSNHSYEKLRKMTKIKCNIDSDLSPSSLRSI